MQKMCRACNEIKEHKSWKAFTCNECLAAGLKYCPKCDQTKAITEFYKNGNTLRSLCKECEIKRSKLSKESTGYYRRPEVRAKRNEDSRLCRQAKYRFDEEYRVAELIRCHNRRKLVTETTLTPLEWLSIVEQFNHSCAYCGTKHNLTMDHVVPVARGGLTEYHNIVPACKSCNSSKKAKDVIDWYTAQPFYDRARLENILKFMRAGA
jgi:5-methylcytosine-specific restriction endonuclease McrA